MASSNIFVFRFKALSDEGVFGFIIFEVDATKKQVINKSSLAGFHENIKKIDLKSSYKDLINALKEIKYYSTQDDTMCLDFQQLTKRLAGDFSFVNELLLAIGNKNLGKIEYTIQNELRHILSSKNIKLESDIFEKTIEKTPQKKPDSAVEKEITLPMKFVLAPFNGTVISRLSIHKKIYATFAKPQEKYTCAWLNNSDLPDKDNPGPILVTLAGLDQVKNSSSICARIVLPDGTKGEIIEESYFIRVKTHLPENSSKYNARMAGLESIVWKLLLTAAIAAICVSVLVNLLF